MPNIDKPIFDEPREHPGFQCKRARVSRQAGSERLGLSLWEVPPGEAAYPYHHHLAEEELGSHGDDLDAHDGSDRRTGAVDGTASGVGPRRTPPGGTPAIEEVLEAALAAARHSRGQT